MKIEDKTLICSGVIVIFMGILLFIFGCVSKIPCDPDKFDPKLISLCASKGYQDKIASLCIENDFLQDELNKCRNTNLRNSDIITNYLNENNQLKIKIDRLESESIDREAYINRIKKSLEEKMENLSLTLEGKKKALERRDKEIEKLEKNK